MVVSMGPTKSVLRINHEPLTDKRVTLFEYARVVVEDTSTHEHVKEDLSI